MNSGSRGFTLIEMIVVIIILGIIGVAAIAMYADLASNAEEKQFNAVRSSYSLAVAELHLKWVVDGYPVSVEVDGVSVILSPAGWPWYTASNSHVPLPLSEYNGRRSVQLWYAIMSSSPTINGTGTETDDGWHGSAEQAAKFTYSYFL